MCSITIATPSLRLSEISRTVCHMQYSSRTARIPSIPITTCSLSVGESASSLALTRPDTLCFTSFMRLGFACSSCFISSPS